MFPHTPLSRIKQLLSKYKVNGAIDILVGDKDKEVAISSSDDDLPVVDLTVSGNTIAFC